MKLAGHVKFKSFMRLMVALLVAGGLAFGLWSWNHGHRLAEQAEKERIEQERERKALAERIEKEEAARQALRAKEEAARAVAEAKAREERQALEAALGDVRDVDRLLMLDWKGKALSSAKLKDVTRGRPYKVNVYQDAGKSSVNRAKVDLDRDDKWDEKWTFEDGGGITRKTAPNDDENYTVEERWDGKAWRR